MIQACADSKLVSSEEEKAAEYLRKTTLAHVNSVSQPVCPKTSFYTKYGKRILDVVISFIAFVVLLPFNLIFGICTFFDVGRPIFFRQVRVGKDGKPFSIIKFRNMNNNTGHDGKLLPPQERVTKFGRFMRKYSLDELLNFYSVLKGDMSVIGPRPQPEFIYNRMSDRHRKRVAVRPGLECPRMIHVPGEEICRLQRTYENDVWYAENVSFLLDIKMVFALVKMTFAMKQRGMQASAKGMTYFVGYTEEGVAISLNEYRDIYGDSIR